jgi:hypothetical protein
MLPVPEIDRRAGVEYATGPVPHRNEPAPGVETPVKEAEVG